MARTRVESAMARWIDGEEHRVMLIETGLKSLMSARNAFRGACYARGLGCVARIDGDHLVLRSLTLEEAMQCGRVTSVKERGSAQARPVATLPTCQLSRLTDQYLRTIPGTAQARELSGLLVQLSRAAQ